MNSTTITSRSRWVVFDTEDDSVELMSRGESGFKKRVTHICAKGEAGETFYSAGNIQSFLKWLMRGGYKFAWAHNAQYDLGNLFGDHLDHLDWMFCGKKFVKALWWGTTFADSYNLYPLRLEQIGQNFGIEKLDGFGKDHCERDVEILWRGVHEVQGLADEYGVELGATLGGLSVRLWRSMGGENFHDNFFISREAYIGGRVELFKHKGAGEITHCDVNSMYPYCLTQSFPGPVALGGDIDREGLCYCRIKVPSIERGPLPVRKFDRSIIFPYGLFNGIWTCAELRDAVARGAQIQKVFGIWTAQETFQPYRKFARHFYAKRLKAKNDAEKLVFKNILNSFSGQLGTRGEIERAVPLTPENHNLGVPFGQRCLVPFSFPSPKHTCVLHAAHVTSYGRLLLQKYMDQIGHEKLIYAATDSIIFDGKPPFKCGVKLGGMKLESVEEMYLCLGNDLYQHGDKFRAKGIKRSYAQAYLENGFVQYDEPWTAKEAILTFDENNLHKLSVWHNVSRRMQGGYNKKRLSGNDYIPLCVNFRRYHEILTEQQNLK